MNIEKIREMVNSKELAYLGLEVRKSGKFKGLLNVKSVNLLRHMGMLVTDSELDLLILNGLAARQILNRPLMDSEIKDFYGLLISEHEGKMLGIKSINTSSLCNGNCLRNSKVKGSICEKCFSMKLQSFRISMQTGLAFNTRLLNYKVLPLDILPHFNALLVRFESFGDLNTMIQFKNANNICLVNPLVKFAHWTKVYKIPNEYFKTNIKPNNLIMLVSSLFVNKVMDSFVWADYIFTVWTTKEEAEKQGYTINCAKKHCFSCGLCYTPNKTGKPILIHELLKMSA